MPIHFDPERKLFHLQAKGVSYVFRLTGGKYPQHVYWGAQVRDFSLDYRKRFPMLPQDDAAFGTDEGTLDVIPQEYPSFGSCDLRVPAVQVQNADGTTVSSLEYASHRIFAGKPSLPGLPATYAEKDDEAQTLEVTLKDALTGLEAVLSYTVFEQYGAVARSVRLSNRGSADIRILRALSMNVDFADSDFDMIQLSGRWAHERQIVKRRLVPGGQSVDCARGISGHQQNPFFALARPGACESTGEVYGFSLVYSGNFLANVEVDQYGGARAQMGVDPFDFSWLLRPGESFQTPETVMVYSAEGFGGMSRTYHDLYRSRLCRGRFRDRERPVLLNNWEATYFAFNEEKLLAIAREAKDLGAEMFVLDDGWFGRRDSDHSSLGDWTPDLRKLPEGLAGLVPKINAMGLKFGLWFEPEMVSPDSDLYRAHPDWCIHIDGRARSLFRHQLELDLTRDEVCEYIIDSMKKILSDSNIEYVKWDMNRYLTEVASAVLPPERQRETSHRYTLALYRIMEELTSSFPNVLFESCASGGGRCDPGLLYYMPQNWTSDMTDAGERLKIQYGTSLVYPAVTMGSHVSAVPNAQNGRTTPLASRGLCAMGGCFGYELDPTRLTEEEKKEIRGQIAFYKTVRRIAQFGDQYRLVNPFESNGCAWIYVSKDRSEAFACYFRQAAVCSPVLGLLRLRGLDPAAKYRVCGTQEIYGGDELMNAGLVLPPMKGDFASCSWKLERV